jgi:hypothetical protein
LFAYPDLGVAAKSSTIGAPISIYGLDPVTLLGGSFVSFLNVYGSNGVKTTQCVRVMVSNPVSCHWGGRVNFTAGERGPITVRSDDGSCTVTSESGVNDPATDGLMAKQICPKGEPGQVTIVLGGTSAFASWLAVAINCPSIATEDTDVPYGYTFAIICNVDARNVFRYRELTLSLQDSNQIQQTNLGRRLTGGDKDCRSFNLDQDLRLMGAAVSANWKDLAQNDGIDGVV